MLYNITNLTKTYQYRTVLDIGRVDIAAGGIHALLGPNGAGKTTLLNILGFLMPPSTGQIRFRSQAVRYNETHLSKLRRCVVLVHQHPILFSTSVRKNVEFGLKIRKVASNERHRIVDEVLDLVGMGDYSQAKAHKLSGGETQRVALARALALSPEVLLCDEPTSSVDVQNQALILSILKKINAEKNITLIFTTHDIDQAKSLATHTIFLDQGRLVERRIENVFDARAVVTDDGRWQWVIQNLIKLPINKFSNRSSDARLKVHIDPERLKLALPDEPHDGALEGKVTQLAVENGRIRVVIDVGIPLCLRLAPDAYRKRSPLIGEPVKVVGIDTACEILS